MYIKLYIKLRGYHACHLVIMYFIVSNFILGRESLLDEKNTTATAEGSSRGHNEAGTSACAVNKVINHTVNIWPYYLSF